MQGTILWFNREKDAGLIDAETGERLPVHGDDFVGGARPQGRCRGSAVTFRLADDPTGRHAEEVALVTEVAPRRARRRSSRRW
jgi:cold shock CspA family protein